MAKNRKTPDMNLPVWFDGQNINEALFCEEFLRERRIIFANGAFFTPDGRVTDDLPLRGEIYAVNGIIANADNKRLKEKLASAEKTASIWKQRYDALNEKYQELKKKAQPYLDALEIASERVRAFISAVLARGKETRELKTPARKRGQDMEI